MHAFNKRFRPTLHFGAFTLLTVALAMFSMLLVAFAGGALIQLGKPALSLIFLLLAIASGFGSVHDHLTLRTLRIRGSIARGKRDRKATRMELVNGK